MKQYHIAKLIILVSVLIVFGCSGGDSGSGLDDTDGKGTGTLALSLTDAPAGDLQAVYVTIEEVRVCVEEVEADNGDIPDAVDNECQWEMIAKPNATYNLLELINGVTEPLGDAELSVGTYYQMRLMIGTDPDDGTNILGDDHPHANYLIGNDNKVHSLKVPSGTQSGVKMVREFEINENKDTDLIVDFDAHKSIVKSGKKDKYILKPTIKVFDPKHMAKLTGTVTDAEGLQIESVAVSAQRTEDPSGVVVEASTITDETGGYQLHLEKNKEYTIVVFSNEYSPACALINIHNGDLPNIWDFSLESSDSGQVTGMITGVADGLDVNLSFRKNSKDCGNGDQEIELLSETIAKDDNDGYVYSVTLPVGGYQVFFYDGVNESSETFDIEAGTESKTVNLAFDTKN